MAEYIDKATLYDEVTEKEKYLDELLANVPSGSIEADIYLGGLTGILWVKQLIANTPPEDVAPVVHTKWLEIEENIVYEDGFWTYKEHCFRCPICFYECAKKLVECPNCGAKMER